MSERAMDYNRYVFSHAKTLKRNVQHENMHCQGCEIKHMLRCNFFFHTMKIIFLSPFFVSRASQCVI